MAKNVNAVDYSGLNTSLQTGHINSIKDGTIQKIGDLFLKSNGFKVEEGSNLNSGMITRRNSKLNEFARIIDTASTGAKIHFILTVNYLVENSLINGEKISSLRLSKLKNDMAPDNKLKAIIKELKKNLKKDDLIKLDNYVHENLISVSNETRKARELRDEVSYFKTENEYLNAELDSIFPWYEKTERAALSRFGLTNSQRVAYRIIKIRENKKKLSTEDVTRKVMWMADKYLSFGFASTVRPFKGYKKMDVNSQYKKIIAKLEKRLESKELGDKEKLAIKRIIREVSNAHTDYTREITEDMKKQNIYKVNYLMNEAGNKSVNPFINKADNNPVNPFINKADNPFNVSEEDDETLAA